MFLLQHRNILRSSVNLIRSMHLDWSPNWKISKKIWDNYKDLTPQKCKVQVTYIWVDGTGQNVRSKTRTMDFTPGTYKDCPNWDFDGSGTHLADVRSSDVLLCPVALYKDPILQGNNKIALCETYTDNGKPTKSNYRHQCVDILSRACKKEPMFGFDQEYQLMDVNNRPFGWPMMLGEPSPLGSYYCSVGADRAFGRSIIECVYRCCLYSGVEVNGTSAKSTPAQWEIQVGPNIGIKAGDDLWMARYFLQRIAEDFGVAISYHPKILPNWKGAGCLTNFSTKEMRSDGGYKFIEEAIKKLDKAHEHHMKVYDPHCGEDNKLRLDGEHGVSQFKKFTSGVGDRTASVRISKKVAQQKHGYFEDRRPAANADPYRIIHAMVGTICIK